MAKKETSSFGRSFQKFKKKGKASKKHSKRKESKNYRKAYVGQGRS